MNYSNRELATFYFQAAAQNVNDLRAYRTQKERIESASASINDYYRLHHDSLNGLKISGIGPKTISILEQILTLGPQETSRVVLQQRLDELHKNPVIRPSTRLDHRQMGKGHFEK